MQHFYMEVSNLAYIFMSNLSPVASLIHTLILPLT